MELISQIKELSVSYFDQIVEIRRHLHSYPELSFHESGTSSYIISLLKEWGIPYKSGYAKHGLVAWIDGTGTGLLAWLACGFLSNNSGKIR